MNSHASFWMSLMVSEPGAAIVQVYQAFDRTSELKSKALPAKVSVLAFREPAFRFIQSSISSHLLSMFFLLSGKVNPRVGGGFVMSVSVKADVVGGVTEERGVSFDFSQLTTAPDTDE